jgi:membrane protein YqaA with SNARE-associated domain
MTIRDRLRRHALDLAAFLWGVAEATLFFFVPDVLLSYIAIKRGPRAALFASFYAAFGASIGGAIMYAWSARDPISAGNAVAAVPAISDLMMEMAAEDMRMNWFDATLMGPLSSTPYKVYAVIAPHVGVSLPAFALASVAARLPRFLIVAVSVAWIARLIEPRLGPRAPFLILTGAWLLFYAAFFALMPN